jgi:hypothetical protein
MSLFYTPDDYDPYKGLNDDERLAAGCFQTLLFMVMIFLTFLICSLFTSCKSHEPTIVERVRTDTVRITQQQRDSIYLRDSIFVNQWQRGDTIFQIRDRWHTQYVMKERTDTFYKAKVDSVPVPYEVIKKVPAELTWWQQCRLHLANIVLWVILIIALWWVIRVAKKMRV